MARGVSIITIGACDGSCRNPGNHAATTSIDGAAAALLLRALATVMPKGNTPTRSIAVVLPGRRLLLTQEGGDLQEGTMYAQGIATIALCEAAAMTEDPTLRGYGEWQSNSSVLRRIKREALAISPGEPGDTTVTGWQLMALKSAQCRAYPFPRQPWIARIAFSIRCRAAMARYTAIKTENPATRRRVGLLGRMYLGWNMITRHYAKA